MIGPDDPEFRRAGETPNQTRARAFGELRAQRGNISLRSPVAINE